jgi:hypothetical protein
MTRIALIALTGLYSSIGLMGLFALASPTVAAQGLVFERAKAPWGTTLQALPRSAFINPKTSTIIRRIYPLS